MNVCDWSDATVVFANSTCFDDTLMRRLASAATALKKGTIFITLTKRLPVGGDSKGQCVRAAHFVCVCFVEISNMTLSLQVLMYAAGSKQCKEWWYCM